MEPNRLWVTAYHTPTREVLVTQHPGWSKEMIFDFNQHLTPRPLTRADLADVRASGAVPRFYSIPNPF